MSQAKFTRRPKRLTDAEIVRLYVEEKLDSDTIAARADCSGVHVLDLVRKAGQEVRPKGGRPGAARKLTDAEIVRRYKAGESGPALAAAADCTTGSVYAVLRRADVPRRTDAATRAHGTRKATAATPWRKSQ